MILAFLLAATQPAPVSLDQIAVYDRLDWSREVTECDRLASHPDDPERVTDGVAQGDVDLEAARLACEAAVAEDPDNPRLNYQLARVNGYAGRHDEGQPYRDAALRAGYPQSLFVVGYIRLTGWDGRGDDAVLWRRADPPLGPGRALRRTGGLSPLCADGPLRRMPVRPAGDRPR
jgi:hypothetical protein